LMIVATRPTAGEAANVPGVATLLMKRTPFTNAEVATMESIAKTMNFELVLTPDASTEPAFDALTNPQTLDGFIAGFRDDVSPPTDDRPFFFKMDSNLLRGLFNYVAVLTIGVIVVPVFLKAEPWVLRDTVSLSLAFSA